jgi:hypothetical protein
MNSDFVKVDKYLDQTGYLKTEWWASKHSKYKSKGFLRGRK